MKSIAYQVHRALHGKPDSANAAENQTAEFQSGYSWAMQHPDHGENWITDEWNRRGHPTEGQAWEDFREWKRGSWAFFMQRAELNLGDA